MKKLRTASGSSAVRALTLLAAVMTTSAVMAANEGLTFYDDEESASQGSKVKSGFSLNATETKDPKKIDWLKRAERGGKANVTVYQDKKGNPIAFYVVGISSINKALKVADEVAAEEHAISTAERNARAALAFYLNSSPEVFGEGSKDMTANATGTTVKGADVEVGLSSQIIKNEGFESGRGAVLLLRGLSLYAGGFVGDKCIRVLRWTAEEQKLAEKAEKFMRGGSDDATVNVEERKSSGVQKKEQKEQKPRNNFSTRDDD